MDTRPHSTDAGDWLACLAEDPEPICGLNERDRVFVLEFLRTKTASHAAVAAGYTKGAGWGLLQRPEILDAIRQQLAASGITEQSVNAWLRGVVFEQDIADYEPYLDGELTLDQLRKCGVDTSRIVEAAERQTKDRHGDVTGVERKIKLLSPEKAMEQLIRLMGLVVERRETEINVNGSVRLDLADAPEDEVLRLAECLEFRQDGNGAAGEMGAGAA